MKIALDFRHLYEDIVRELRKCYISVFVILSYICCVCSCAPAVEENQISAVSSVKEKTGVPVVSLGNEDDLIPDWSRRYSSVELEFVGEFEPHKGPVGLISPKFIRVCSGKLYTYDVAQGILGMFSLEGEYLSHYGTNDFKTDLIRDMDVDDEGNIFLVGTEYIYIIVGGELKKIRNLYGVWTGAFFRNRIWVNGGPWTAGKEGFLLRTFDYEFNYIESKFDYLFDPKWGGMRHLRPSINSSRSGLVVFSKWVPEILIINDELTHVVLQDPSYREIEKFNQASFDKFEGGDEVELYGVLNDVESCGNDIYALISGQCIARMNNNGVIKMIYRVPTEMPMIINKMEIANCEAAYRIFLIASKNQEDNSILIYEIDREVN
jgi:uncharacterized protein YuzB (UPF0349 family)